MNDIIEQYSRVFRSAPGAILIVDAAGKIVFANDALNKIFGYSDDELVNQPIELLIPKDARAGHPELRDAFLHLPATRGMGEGRDLYGVSKSDDLIPLEIGLNPVKSGEESFVVASVLDLSERRKVEEKTRLAIDAASNAMIMTNAQGVIVLANAQSTEMFGYLAEDLIGKPIETLIPAEFKNRHKVYRANYSALPSKRSMGAERTLFGMRKGGSKFPLEIGLTPIENQGEHFTMATISDITERKLAEEELRKKNNDLSRLNHELGQFAYSASHDLKAPLSSIEGLLNCIEEDARCGDTESVMEQARMAKDLAGRLKTLIESLLGLAQAESLPDENKVVNVLELVEAVVQLLSVDKANSSLDLTVDIDPELSVTLQPIRLHQVFENLISNSIKYIDATKDKSYVQISASQEQDCLKLSVKDNGIGIPPEKHDEVFMLFRRFRNHNIEGSGLGLALVKQHVEALNGTIYFTSDGFETLFTVQIPIDSALQLEKVGAIGNY